MTTSNQTQPWSDAALKAATELHETFGGYGYCSVKPHAIRCKAKIVQSAIDAELQSLRTRLKQAEHDRNLAVKEAARRDEKWKQGIQEECGTKIAFDIPHLEQREPTLGELIRSLKKQLQQAEDAAAKANQTVDALMSSNCNMNDTLRSRGFINGSTEERLIALAQAHDTSQQRVAELEKDKERLDWLDDQSIILNTLFASEDAVKRYFHIYRQGFHFGGADTALLTLRQAIDAAIASTHERKETK